MKILAWTEDYPSVQAKASVESAETRLSAAAEVASAELRAVASYDYWAEGHQVQDSGTVGAGFEVQVAPSSQEVAPCCLGNTQAAAFRGLDHLHEAEAEARVILVDLGREDIDPCHLDSAGSDPVPALAPGLVQETVVSVHPHERQVPVVTWTSSVPGSSVVEACPETAAEWGYRPGHSVLHEIGSH